MEYEINLKTSQIIYELWDSVFLILFQVYDLLMTAALLLTLLLYMPHVKWQEGEQQPLFTSHSQGK